jgi:hypothetical protein
MVPNAYASPLYARRFKQHQREMLQMEMAQRKAIIDEREARMVARRAARADAAAAENA